MPAKRPERTTRPPRVSKPDSYNNISSDAVERATGRGWSEWLEVLDRENAAALPHPEIALLVRNKYSVPAWWSQMVTVGYEQARGLRVQHQKPGGFEVSATRTMDVPVEDAYAAFTVPAKRRGWCPSTDFSVRRATRSRSLRITWPDDSDVNVMFYTRGPMRSTVTVQHSKLANASDATAYQNKWRVALETLATKLEARPGRPSQHALDAEIGRVSQRKAPRKRRT